MNEQIVETARKNPPHKVPWMLRVIPEMRVLEQPNLELITNLHQFPNIGLPEQTYQRIQERVTETLEMLREKGYCN